MKKAVAALLSACMLFSLCGCGGPGAGSGEDPGHSDPAGELVTPVKDLPGTVRDKDEKPDPGPDPGTDPDHDPGSGSGSDPSKPVVDYRGPDGRDSRLVEMESQSMLRKACRVMDSFGDAAGENAILSPLSVWMAMGMAAAGSGPDSETREDMESFLGMDSAAFDAFAKDLIAGAGDNYDTKLEIANGVWFDDDFSNLRREFTDVIKAAYGGEAKTSPMGDSTCGEINQFVSDVTRGMIPFIVDSLPPECVAVLVNALYFDAAWVDPYDPDYSVSEGVFHGRDGDATVEYMSSTESAYMENDKAVAFAKTYLDGYRFVGILPKDSDWTSLEALDLDSLLDSVTYDYDVDAKLPKFEFESSMELSGVLKAMGLELPFDQSADFTGMFEDPRDGAFISKILHKAKIEVTETGTKAAAATAIGMETCGIEIEIPERRTVELDRPFVFVILDKDGTTPLFVGRFMAPEA